MTDLTNDIPKLGQKYAHHWFNTAPHGVWELAALIDRAIEEAWQSRKIESPSEYSDDAK